MLPMIVAEHGDSPILLGKTWLSHLRLNWHGIFSVHSDRINKVKLDLFVKTAICSLIVMMVQRVLKQKLKCVRMQNQYM